MGNVIDITRILEGKKAKETLDNMIVETNVSEVKRIDTLNKDELLDYMVERSLSLNQAKLTCMEENIPFVDGSIAMLNELCYLIEKGKLDFDTN